MDCSVVDEIDCLGDGGGGHLAEYDTNEENKRCGECEKVYFVINEC